MAGMLALSALALGQAPVFGSLEPASAQARPAPPRQQSDNTSGVVRPTDDSYEGAIFISGSDDVNSESTSGGGNRCEGCVWTLVIACSGNDPDGVTDNLCVGAGVNCPPNTTRNRIYLTRPGQPRRQVAVVCLGAGAVVTAADVGAEAQRAFDDLPLVGAPPRLGQANPPLAKLATYFIATGDPAETVTVDLAGLELVVTATARYDWNFGDGTTLSTTTRGRGYQPGDNTRQGPAAAGAIMHWYDAPGTVTASVQTTWTGSFTFGEEGAAVAPTPVAGAVTPPAEVLTIDVREGRATLYN